MNFIGNQKIISRLQNLLQGDNLNHAYLFMGPEKVGKFTLAKMFALALITGNALQRETDFFDKDAAMDLIVLEPEVVEKKNVSKQRDISIENVRDAKVGLSLFPYQGKRKVLIVNDAHRLNVAAQNALLKILEEPNPTTVIILVTHEPDRILPTIFSRCQMVNFSLADEDELNQTFAELDDVSTLAIGRPGFAKMLAEDVQVKEFAQEASSDLELLTRSSLGQRFAMAEKMSKDVVKTLEKLNMWLWQLRKRALRETGIDQQTLYLKMEKIQESINILKKTNANSKLVLETLFMDL